MENYIQDTKELLEFIKNSPSPFHVVSNMKRELIKAGFKELIETKPFNIETIKPTPIKIIQNTSFLSYFIFTFSFFKYKYIFYRHTK